MHYVFHFSGKSLDVLDKTEFDAAKLLQRQSHMYDLSIGMVDDEEILYPILASIKRLNAFIRFLKNIKPNTFYQRHDIDTWRSEFPQFENFFSCFKRKLSIEPTIPLSLHKQVVLQNYRRRISEKRLCTQASQCTTPQEKDENSELNSRSLIPK